MIGIYRIYHKDTGKTYVGQSRNIKKRANGHFYAQTGRLSYVERAIQKHGREAFGLEILELCSEDILSDRECHWIASLDCMAPNGYNLAPGGSGSRHTPETIRKISEANKRIKGSPEHRSMMSAKMKGRKWTPEHCRKISEAKKRAYREKCKNKQQLLLFEE